MEQVGRLHADLSVPTDYAERCGLPLCEIPPDLVSTELDYYGRPQRLTEAAFRAWSKMKQSAAAAGISIHLISAFRDLDYQHQLILKKLLQGQSIERSCGLMPRQDTANITRAAPSILEPSSVTPGRGV
jgi:D-alanyl-D-alanine carboxypeptidase